MNIRPSDGRLIDFSNACRNVPLPGPKRPIHIWYVVMSIPILELSAVLCTVQASVLFRSFQIRGHISHTTRGRPFGASVVFQAKRSPLSCSQQ